MGWKARKRRAKKAVATRHINTLAKQAEELEKVDPTPQIPETTPENDIYAQFKANPLLWARFYCGRHFRLKSPPFHLALLRAAVTERYLAVASPRESSKSTLLAFVYPFHGICFKRFRFIVILSNTFKKASMHLETMKQELRDNERLMASFVKHPQITKDAEGDSEFRHPDGFMTKVLCKGSDQIGSIRGVKFGAWRPDLVIVDDVEDDELVKNPVRRQELQNNVDEALIPAGEAGKCQFIWIGTILHDDSQLAKMVMHAEIYPEYKKLFYAAHLDPDGPNEKSLWPEKWTVEQLKELRRDKPLVYAKEYQNDPVAGIAGVFQQRDFRYWRVVDDQYELMDEGGNVRNRGDMRWCKAAIACDLAWEAKRQADFCVIMPGYLTPNSDLLIGDYIARKGIRPNEIEEIIFSMVAKLQAETGGSVPIGMEKAKLEKVIRWMLREAMRRRNRPLLLKDLIWDTDKIGRIETRLQSRYSQHMIYHLHGQGELEHQLLRFPSAAHDDLPDAEQGLVQLLQYPKKPKQAKPEMDLFEQLRIMSKRSRMPHGKGLFQIGQPGNSQIIPAQTSPLG
jgi:hypothetical protein